MDKSRLFLYFMLSFLLGIVVARFLAERDFLKLIFLFVVTCFLAGKFLARPDAGPGFCLVIFAGIVLGVLRFYLAFEFSGAAELNRYTGNVEIRGCVCDEVDVRDDKVKYTLCSEQLKIAGGEVSQWQPATGRVLVSASRYPVYKYGECLLVSGELRRPERIEDFAYDKYLARYGIYSVMYRARVERDESGAGDRSGSVLSALFSRIYSFKGDFETRLRRIFPEPHASFMAGLILGSRKGIPEHLMRDFNATGLTHIIAISGYNITLVIMVVSAFFGFLGRRKKVLAAVTFIVVFVVMVGMSAAVVRAAIMGIIGLFAVWFGRQYFVGIALVSAAFFMNIWNPLILLYDVGFQLSFLATCGLIYVFPALEKFFAVFLRPFDSGGFVLLAMKEAFLMTLSAQVLALPVIILNFERLSLVAPLANVFVLPLIPLAMIFGFFAVLMSYLWGFFGFVFGFCAYLILELQILFVKFFAVFGFASVEIHWFSWWMGGVYYWVVLRVGLRGTRS